MSMRFPYVFAAMALIGCGSPKSDEDAKKPAPTPEPSVFVAEIDPILEKSCGGCHSAGAKHTPFVGDEAVFKASAEGVAFRITTTDPKLVMPPARAREPLTPEESQKILQFLGKS